VEPIQGEGGVRLTSARFMCKPRLLTRIYDVPLVFDDPAPLIRLFVGPDGVDGYDGWARKTPPNRLVAEDVTVLNTYARARSGHVRWQALLEDRAPAWLAAIDPGWDAATTDDSEWERAGIAGKVEAAFAAMNIAEIYLEQGKLDEAEALLRDASRELRSSGEFQGLAGSLTYLGRVQARAGRLAEAEELLRQAQQVASIGTFEWNIKTGVNRWTPELETMYGLPQGGFLGTQAAWEQLVHPEDRDESVRGLARALKEGSFEGEWRVIWPDGSVHWLLGRALIFKDEAGEPERLIGVNIDVTARKRAESALEQSERRFREIIDLLPAAICTTDAEGRLTHFNRAAVELSGRTPQLGTDRWCVTWKLFRPDGTRLPHDECPMAVALKKGLVVDGVEAIAERPDGSRVWFTPYPRPLRNAEGAVIGEAAGGRQRGLGRAAWPIALNGGLIGLLDLDTLVSIILFCGAGLLLSLSVLLLDQYIPGEWF
jgi:PAS domain S-box-containing protein